MESRLKESISEIVWRATESHREARRFYEDQKREILELGASILTRLDRQLVGGGGTTHQDTDEEDELDMLRKQRIELESEINAQQLKSIAQASELEALKEETAELRKQLDTLRKRITARDGKGPCVSAVDAELQTEPVMISKEGGGDGDDDDGRSPDWADVVNSEEIWEQKYHELECKYTALVQERPDLDKRISMLERENKRLLASTPPLTVIDQPTHTTLRRNHGAMDRQRKHRSMMAPPVSTSPTPSNHSRTTTTPRKHNDQQQQQQRQSYFMNEEGHLTFTTEINGRLSQYTVKLPTKDHHHHHHHHHYNNGGGTSRLNPNAPAWKAPA